MPTESVMPSNRLNLCCPLLLLQTILPSIRVFSSELALRIREPKYWSFNINLSNEYSGLISFRIDWFDLLTVQGTLKSLLQHHNLKAFIHWYSVFLMVQLSHPHMTAGGKMNFKSQPMEEKCHHGMHAELGVKRSSLDS